jgi:hypothetical protein
VDALPDDWISGLWRRGKPARVGQLAAEIEAADEGEQVTEGRAPLGAEFFREQKRGARRENLLCAPAFAVGR